MPRISVNGIELNVHTEGDGEAVLLLHGAPDSIALWRRVGPRLVSAGYRIVAIDQRGFGESDAPKGKRCYELASLADDVLSVMDALGVERAHLVGHDWGAAVAWLLAGSQPQRFATFTALSVGHARAYAAAGIQQLKKAWYIAPVLVPWLGEWLLRMGSWRLLRSLTTNHPEAERWIRDLSRPGRLTAGMNWYRANSLSPLRQPNVTIPVLGVWSDGDFALTEAQMLGSARFVEGPFRYHRFEGVGHWIPLDIPEQLCDLLLQFFAEAQSATPGPAPATR